MNKLELEIKEQEKLVADYKSRMAEVPDNLRRALEVPYTIAWEKLHKLKQKQKKG